MSSKFSFIFLCTILFGLLFIIDNNQCRATRESTSSIMNRRFYGRPPPLFSGRYGQVVDILGDDDDLTEINKRQLSDDYGHMRFGKRDQFDDYGHMRFGRNHE